MDIDRHWDFSDPSGTEVRIREVLESLPPESDRERAIALSQVARAMGLQGKIKEARETLEVAKKHAQASDDEAAVCVELEQGRLLNSSGNSAESIRHFLLARGLAQRAGLETFEIDALHMLAIVDTERAEGWSIEAICLAQRSNSPKSRRWLATLYNNYGWTCFEKKDYERALPLFEQALEAREKSGQLRSIQIARWAIARCLRAIGKNAEALEAQLDLLDNGPEDGFVHEEIAHLTSGERQRLHARKALELLESDSWLVQTEPERIQALKRLSR